jgi:hypothetical protein
VLQAIPVIPATAARVALAALVILFGGGATDVAAQSPELPVITRDGSGQTIIRATRISTPPRLDGRLDDAVYREVTPVMGFIQQEPREGEPVTEATQAWVMFDDDNIYIACRCSDAHPETIESKDMRRDSSNQRFTDSFGVMLDTFHDRRNGYIFTITPSGGFTDALVTDERVFNPDWNTVWAIRGPVGSILRGQRIHEPVWNESHVILDRSQIQGAGNAATCGIRGRPGRGGGHRPLGPGPSRLRHVPDERGHRDHGHRHRPRFRQSAFLAVSGRHSTGRQGRGDALRDALGGHPAPLGLVAGPLPGREEDHDHGFARP